MTRPASASDFSARLLKTSARGLGALATEGLFRQRPGIEGRYQPHAAGKWRDAIGARVAYLAAAVSTGRAEVFQRHMNWDKIAHFARGGEDACADLYASLEALRDAIAKELPAAAAEPALRVLDQTIRAFADAPLTSPTLLNLSTREGRLAGEYLLAVQEGDRARASALVLDAVLRPGDGGPALSVMEVYSAVLTPAQRELGRLWHLNESTVAEEHFATATTHMVISMLYPHLRRREPNGRTVLAASVETNAHDIGVRMVADALEIQGWRAIYLGPNVPIDDLAIAARDFRVDLVAMSAGLSTHLPILREAIQGVRSLCAASHAGRPGFDPAIMVGGGAFLDAPGDLWREMGADGFAMDLETAVAEASRLCG